MAEETTENVELGLTPYQKAAAIHLIVAVLVLLVSLGCFFHFVTQLKATHDSFTELAAKQVESRFDVFSRKIKKAKKTAASQYQAHFAKREAKGLVDVHKTYTTLNEMTYQAEQDFLEFLSLYQKLSYESASRVRGSGEWFYYFNKDILALRKKTEQREKKMTDYFQDEEESG